ncbi:MAG: S1 RNA-binding domain-containing protein, partial [Candidatus Omnitrophica bacterium]|nr:S1 RNA-binding domain-containing protein [Candidatus Omnitrophota bacterium]
MMQVIGQPKNDVSSFAPKIVVLKINQEKIGAVIGPGGKIIKKIIQDTGATVDIDDDGTVQVAGTDPKSIEMAVAIIKGITEEPEVGKIYRAKVKKIMNFGAFVEILPGKEGLVHVSELSNTFVKNVEEVVKLGDEFDVKLTEIDSQGRLNLSKKQADPNYKPGAEKEKSQDDSRRKRS